MDAARLYRGRMNSDEQARPLSEVIGDRLRLFREAKQLRQDDVAQAAKELGLSWGRSSIASLEAGARNLSVEELVALPVIIKELGGWEEPFIPADAMIALPGDTAMPSANFLGNLRHLWIPIHVDKPVVPVAPPVDEVMDLGQFFYDETNEFATNKSIAKVVLAYSAMAMRIWPKSGVHSYATVPTDLTMKIASRLIRPDGEPVAHLLANIMAQALWGASANVERDRRAAERGPYDGQRALQSARGHVTRELISELQAELNRNFNKVVEIEQEIAEAVRSEETLERWTNGLRKEQELFREKHLSELTAQRIASRKSKEIALVGDVYMDDNDTNNFVIVSPGRRRHARPRRIFPKRKD